MMTDYNSDRGTWACMLSTAQLTNAPWQHCQHFGSRQPNRMAKRGQGIMFLVPE
jgi:hypothetical protein